MKYIDADKLKAEIRKLRSESCISESDDYYEYAKSEIIDIIKSLQQEQPEVDLEKELDQWRHKHFKGKRDDDYSGEYLERESQLDLARHFYELGRMGKEESVSVAESPSKTFPRVNEFDCGSSYRH